MSSTSTTDTTQGSTSHHPAPAVRRWRSWPMAEHAGWSWLVPLAVVGVGGSVDYLGGGPLWGAAAAAALALTLWQFVLPVDYEISPAGCSRQVLGRERLVPWSAVHSFHPRTTGVVLFRRADPAAVDALGSWFVPYPADKDEVLAMTRFYLQHATELPT